MTGGSGEPPARPGTIRRLTFSNPQTSAITVSLYDSASTTLTTSVAAYNTWAYVIADAYGFYEYGTTPRDAVGTPFWSDDTTFTPPDAVPTGTGLPAPAPAEDQDYEDLAGVYTLRRYPGTKVDETTVGANASTALVPFFQIIVPASTTLYSFDGPWAYVSGIVGKTDNAAAITLAMVSDG